MLDDNMFLHGNKIAIGWPEMGSYFYIIYLHLYEKSNAINV